MARRAPLPREDGAAAVEFALVSVLLLTLLFGIIQYAFFFFQSQGASATTRETSRLAAVGVTSCTSFEAAALSRANANGTDVSDATAPTDDITLTMTGPTGTAVPGASVGDIAKVTVRWVPQKFGFPFVPFISSNVTESAETRVESVGTATVVSC